VLELRPSSNLFSSGFFILMNTIVMFNTYLLLLGRIINLQFNSKCTLYFTTKNFIWLFIEVPVPSTESEPSYIFVLEVSMLPLSTILILDFGTVPTVGYFGTVPTVWYFRTVPTVWYFGTVPTVWYCFCFSFNSIVLLWDYLVGAIFRNTPLHTIIGHFHIYK
jgi:hypothetical protein